MKEREISAAPGGLTLGILLLVVPLCIAGTVAVAGIVPVHPSAVLAPRVLVGGRDFILRERVTRREDHE